MDVDGLVACVCEQLPSSGGASAPDVLGRLEAVKKQKLYLEGKKVTDTVVFTECVCPSPPPHPTPILQILGLVRGSWFRIAHGQAFSWQKVVILADKDFPLLTHRIAGCLVVFMFRPSTFGFILNFSALLWGLLILKGNMHENFSRYHAQWHIAPPRLWLNCPELGLLPSSESQTPLLGQSLD